MAKQPSDVRVPYTAEEINMIQESSLKNLKDLAFMMGRSYSSVRRKKWALDNPNRDKSTKTAYKKAYQKDHDQGCVNNKWSKVEEELLLHSRQTDAEIAKRLKRSIGSVQTKRYRLLKERKNGKRRSNNSIPTES